MEECQVGARYSARLGLTRLELVLPAPLARKKVYYTMGSPVYKTTMTAWPAFLGFCGKEKGGGLDLEESLISLTPGLLFVLTRCSARAAESDKISMFDCLLLTSNPQQSGQEGTIWRAGCLSWPSFKI